MDHKRTSVLWIAPIVEGLPELAWLKELGRLSALDIDLATLTGDDIDLSDVADILQKRADLVLFSGHGGIDGLILRAGQLIRPKWFASLLSTRTQPQLAVIAACSSQGYHFPVSGMTSAISAVGIDAVGFPAETEDTLAATFSLEIVRAYSSGETTFEAFSIGYEAIKGTSLAAGLVFSAGIRQTPRRIDERLMGLEKAVTSLSDYIRSITEWSKFTLATDRAIRTATDAIRGIDAPSAKGNDESSPQVDGE